MNKAFFAIALYVILFLNACQIESQDPFVRKELAKRFTKDSFFRHAVQSPIHPNDRKFFLNLEYFDPKPEYIVKAKFNAVNPPQSIYIQDTEGTEQEYYRVGKLHFELQDKTCTLSVFQRAKNIYDPDKNTTLFLPFFDETNGDETYKTGRYLDIPYNDKLQEIEINFNEAYNPYCAYTEDYKCPVPPAENRLPFRVEAGEMVYY